MTFRGFMHSSTRVWCLLSLGSVTACTLQSGQRLGVTEQRIAGISVGDGISSAKRLFPRLSETGGRGVWTVPIGRNCRLELVVSGTRIGVITLERARPHDLQEDTVCDSVRTGAGLPFGAGLDGVKRAYKALALMEAGKEPALYRGDNGPECLGRRSPVLRSMFVYWSNVSRRIQTFSVEASRAACEEYRDTEAERQR